jgi:hypothetical protein
MKLHKASIEHLVQMMVILAQISSQKQVPVIRQVRVSNHIFFESIWKNKKDC